MSTVALAVGGVAWCALAAVVAPRLGRMTELRDRQIPRMDWR